MNLEIQHESAIGQVHSAINHAIEIDKLLKEVSQPDFVFSRLKFTASNYGQTDAGGMELSSRERECLELFKAFLVHLAKMHREEAQDWLKYTLNSGIES